MQEAAAAAQSTLAAWDLADAELTPITTGHINETYKVVRGTQAWVLQRLSRIFAPEVNLDIETVTRHLLARGLVTPLLVRCGDGAAWHLDAHGRPWRLLTFIDGVCHERATSCAMVGSAGALLGRFHGALLDLNHSFAAPRLGVHDTARHLNALRQALRQHTGHAAYAQVATLAHEVLTAAGSLAIEQAPSQRRIVHGDPKISNILFDHSEAAVALVDLDTLAHMAVTDELGDALRSWCNRSGEVPKDSRFDVALLDAALSGYASAAPQLLARDERALLAQAPLKIALELTARFACDALEESYFGWNRQLYPASWAHQLDRARSQWAVAQSALAQSELIAQSVARHLG